jgi:hypothetical protein
MKKLVIVSIFALGFISCGEDSKETEAETKEVATDSLTTDTLVESVELPPMDDMLQSIADRSGEYYTLPFSIDSGYFDPFEGEDISLIRLTGEEVKYLSPSNPGNNITHQNDWDIKTFVRIDSLEVNGKYDEYVDNLDIGMTKRSEAFMGEKILISDSTFIQLWSISYSSFEACPYSSGTVIYGTNIHNNQVTNVAILGEMSGGGDPPVWGDTFIGSEITASSIITKKRDRYGEYDDETGEDIVEEDDIKESTLTFGSEGFVVNK